MSQIKVCPHCGSKMFVGTITRGCAIESIIDENGDASFNVVKESSGDKYELEVLKCCRCREEITKDDLVEGVVCKECGKIVGPDEVDENGVCEVCSAMKQRTELANASKEDIIRMLLEAEKKANSVTSKVEKQLKKAEEIENKVEEQNTDTEKPKKRRTKVKVSCKAEEAKNEETSEEEVIKKESEIIEQVPEEVAILQEDAPFPEIVDNDISGNTEEPPMNLPETEESQNVVPDLDSNNESFPMYDNRDDEQF